MIFQKSLSSIACEFGSPDLEFFWQDAVSQDPAQAAQINVAYVSAGILTPDEARASLGLAPLPQASGQIAQALTPPAGKLAKLDVHKYNHYHDSEGRFASQSAIYRAV